MQPRLAKNDFFVFKNKKTYSSENSIFLNFAPIQQCAVVLYLIYHNHYGFQYDTYFCKVSAVLHPHLAHCIIIMALD